jgi:hypothetical protein
MSSGEKGEPNHGAADQDKRDVEQSSVIVDFGKLAGDCPPLDAGIRTCRFDMGNKRS